MTILKKENISDDVYGMYSLGESFCLYREPSDGPITKDMVCYVDDNVAVNDNDEDIYPYFSKNNGLEFFYSGERFIDVILSVLEQVEDPSTDIFIEALNYYDENDTFLNIET